MVFQKTAAIVRLAGLLFLAAILAGCAGEFARLTGKQQPAFVSARAGAPAHAGDPSVPGAYPIDSGDRLQIRVFDQASLSGQYSVNGAGYISMPLIGNVLVRGKTTPAIETQIAAKLRAGYLRNPDVSVEVLNFRPFFILGQVNRAGQYPYVNAMTIETAVAIAGGYSPRARKRRIRITRNTASGPRTFYQPPSARVYPGDTIFVKERFF